MMRFKFNKIDDVMCFSKMICKFLICFNIRKSKISDKADKVFVTLEQIIQT